MKHASATGASVPLILRGPIGRVVGRWMDSHDWQLHRIVRTQDGLPLARVRIRPGQPIREYDIQNNWQPGGFVHSWGERP